MANDKPSSNLERAAQAAEDFEDKHYKGGELDAQDFKAAGEKATAAVSDAAVAVKEAVVGPADPKGNPATAPTAEHADDAPASTAATPDNGPSVISQLQDKAAGALASMQQAVEPKPGDKSADPEVNEFRSLVAEVFDNMKESIATGNSSASPTPQQGPSGGVLPAEVGAAANAAQRKAVASSPAEARTGVLGQLMDKIMPVAEAEGRSPGQKWEDAKGEARESGHEAKESARDAASALGDETRRGYNRAERETRHFLNRAGEASVGAAQEGVDVARDARDRVKRNWPGAEVRGVVEETKDLTRSAADRVKEDWERTKEGTQEMLDNSSSPRQWRAERAPPPKKERGFFGSISHALFGGNDDVEDAAERTRASARSAADDASNKAHEAKENTKSFFNKAGDEAQREASRAEDKTRGFFGRASDETRRSADRAEDKARGFWGSTKDEANKAEAKAEAKFNRWGDRINESVEDTKRTVQDKWNRAEDYLEADLQPQTSGEAAAQAGYIPSNTQDVLASRVNRRGY